MVRPFAQVLVVFGFNRLMWNFFRVSVDPGYSRFALNFVNETLDSSAGLTIAASFSALKLFFQRF